MDSSSQIQLFEAFDGYDFGADASFQSGLKTIEASLLAGTTGDDRTEALLKAKFFYYSKFVSPFDFNSYLEWKRSGTYPGVTGPAIGLSKQDDGPAADTAAAKQAQSAEPQYPPTFAEICDMVAKGLPIPGIRQIPSTVLEGQKSPSTMAPRKKPWERPAVTGASVASN